MWLFTIPKQMFLSGNGLRLIMDLNVTVNDSRWTKNRSIILSAKVEGMSFFESGIDQ